MADVTTLHTKGGEPDDGVARLGERAIRLLITFTRRYVVLPSEAHELIFVIWIIHTWMVDAAHTTPYLWIYSKGPQAGKTRVLDVAGVLACNAQRSDDMTAPVMFKLIERCRNIVTLLTDEIDTIWSGSRNDWKRRTFNTGYKRGGSAWREEARELKEFSTFCPKALAGIHNGFMPGTIRDRCIPFPMVKKSKSQPVERFNEHDVERGAEREEALQAVEQFRTEHLVDVMAMRPPALGALSDRQNEITEPLLAIAAVAGVERELRMALQEVFLETQSESEDTPTSRLLERIKDAFDGDSKMFSRHLCEKLGPAYTGRQLALWLEPLGVAPREIRIGNKQARGYHAVDFEELWERYCQPALSVVDSETDDFDEITEVEA